MKEPVELREGVVVRTTALDRTAGFIIDRRHLVQRRPDTLGVVMYPVPGHGGDVWFVAHEKDEHLTAYGTREFDLSDVPAIWAVQYTSQGDNGKQYMRREFDVLENARDYALELEETPSRADVRIVGPFFGQKAKEEELDISPERKSAWDRLQGDDGL